MFNFARGGRKAEASAPPMDCMSNDDLQVTFEVLNKDPLLLDNLYRHIKLIADTLALFMEPRQIIETPTSPP